MLITARHASLNKSDEAPFQYGHLSLKAILAVRDKRLAQTIDTVLLYNGRGFTRFNTGMESTSSTGYGVAKYDNEAIPEGFRSQSGKNYTHAPLFWLSVIYRVDANVLNPNIGYHYRTSVHNGVHDESPRLNR